MRWFERLLAAIEYRLARSAAEKELRSKHLIIRQRDR